MDFRLIEVWEIHPGLVHFPIGLLLSGVAADVWAVWRPRETLTRAAAGLLVAGVITGWLAAGAGLLAFFTVPGHTEEAHVWMYWHLGFAVAMMLAFTAVAVVRWRRRAEPAGRGLVAVALFAALLLLVTSYLGGIIVYRGGAGVDPELLAPEAHEHEH